MAVAADIGFPLIVRPSYILGGKGTGIAADESELRRLAAEGLDASPISEILVERSIAGWKEFELEVMRDHADNCVVVCSIENLDPMGVHTGDSITVAPAQTLSDVEYQRMRDAAFACIRRIGVETGGSNIQFATDPAHRRDGRHRDEPPGEPQLGAGVEGDRLPDRQDRRPPRGRLHARRDPERHHRDDARELRADHRLRRHQGAAVGVREAAGLERRARHADAVGRRGDGHRPHVPRVARRRRCARSSSDVTASTAIRRRRSTTSWTKTSSSGARAVATPDRPFHLEAALRRGITVERLAAATAVDPWFLDQILAIVEERAELERVGFAAMDRHSWQRAKRLGFSDAQLGYLWGVDARTVRAAREGHRVKPTFKTVDTCAAEFDAATPYHYSTYEDDSEVRESERRKIVILGSGPNRIGQGIEFDYCCVHASFALRDAGFETVMVNCNPETVSTDYDTSDRLYFEPITDEDVLNIIEAEQPEGVIVSLGGQTPLKLAGKLPPGLVLGTSPDVDRPGRGPRPVERRCATASRSRSPRAAPRPRSTQALAITARIGYPALVRPSYVLGGRAMEIVVRRRGPRRGRWPSLRASAPSASKAACPPSGPVLVDRFLEDAVEVDVDALRDATGEVLIGGVMEHVEEAGVHSGDSACVIPPPTLSPSVVQVIEGYTRAIADALDVRGLINVQYAVKSGQVFVIEANPRASRTVPFVAKATGVPLAKIAARIMVGATLSRVAATRASCANRRPVGTSR